MYNHHKRGKQMVIVQYLADYPEYQKTIINWYKQNWAELLSQKKEQQWSEIVTLNKSFIPITLIAIENFDIGAPEIVGSVILQRGNSEIFHTPCVDITCLFVPEHARGRGIGKMLVKHICKVANHLGYESVYVYTPNFAEWFEKRGWAEVFSKNWQGKEITIMCKDLIDYHL